MEITRDVVEKESERMPDPSINQLKQVIMLEIGLPLGIRFFIDNLTVNPKVFKEKRLKGAGTSPRKLKMKDEDGKEESLFDKKKEKTILNNKCYLFYGPKGTGKEMMVNALAYETNSFLFGESHESCNQRTGLGPNEQMLQ